MLARNASGYPQPDSQSAPDGVRFHSVYDGSSDRRLKASQGFPLFSVARKR
jgi:hypothetical protein